MEKKKKKENNSIGYRFLKLTFGNLFKLYYRPKVYNKEIIPNEGPIIICGNHIHLFDQNLACISTKRVIHYMAKIEHLNGKFGWFFKMAGCIGVNREIHDTLAKSKALEVLNNGYALGIFPEGTRNRLIGKKDRKEEIYNKYYKKQMSLEEFEEIIKENEVSISEVDLLDKLLEEKRITKNAYASYLLNSFESIEKLYNDSFITNEEYDSSLFLPLKYGAVSLAQKTGATIVPYVTTGRYKFKNNHLNARFGTPFKVGKEMDLNEANDILLKEMIRLKKEGLEDIKKGLI